VVEAQRQIEHWIAREHEAVARRLLADPEGVIARARNNLDRWAVRYERMPAWMDEWRRILSEPVEVVVRVLREDSERAVWLRSCSPFAGALTARERWAIRKGLD
jgi:hypothetical protein